MRLENGMVVFLFLRFGDLVCGPLDDREVGLRYNSFGARGSCFGVVGFTKALLICL